MEVYFTDNEFYECLFGVTGLLFGFIISINMPISYEIVIRWSIMWFFRKIGLNIYISIKKKYNIKDKRFIIFPYPKIIS